MQLLGGGFVVAGGASGLGEAVCRALAARGARGVGILDLDATRGERLAASLGGCAVFAQADVADADEVSRALAHLEAQLGPLHGVVYCAAIGGPARLVGRDGPIAMAAFDRVLRVNLYGAVHVLRAAVPRMLANPPDSEGERGAVILVSSGAAYEGQIGQMAYSASKAALIGMALPLARELGARGIRVIAVAPGAFDTPMYAQAPEGLKERLARHAIFPRRMGRAEEFARFALEILENPMHNGRCYRFDAGMSLPPA